MWNANLSQPLSERRISRMPELILGVIGGVLGLLFIPVRSSSVHSGRHLLEARVLFTRKQQ